MRVLFALQLLAALSLPTVGIAQQSVEVWLRAFIPDPSNAGSAGEYIRTVTSGVGSIVRFPATETPLSLCFATDHRGFSIASNSTARLQTRFTITLNSNGTGQVSPQQGRTAAAVTKKVSCTGGTVLVEGQGTVDRDNLGTPAVADGIVQVVGQAQGRNVLTPAGRNGPSIDYSFSVQWKGATRTLTAEVTYGVFPAFEMYARKPGGPWVTVMRHLPSGAPWRLGGDSFGVNSQRQKETVLVP